MSTTPIPWVSRGNLHVAVMRDPTDDVEWRGTVTAQRKNLVASVLNPDHHHGHMQSWIGAPSLETFHERVRKGWPDGVNKARALTLPRLTLVSVRRRLRIGDHGDMLRPEAVLGMAQPDRAWKRPVRLQSHAPRILTIHCNLACAAYEDAKDLLWRGAAALRAAEACAAAGIPFRIVATQESSCWGRMRVATVVTLKEPSQPLNAPLLAALVCMPGWKRLTAHRNICHAWPEADSGLGQSRDTAADTFEAAGIDPKTLWQMPSSLTSEETANEWLAGFATFANDANK